MQGFPFDEMHRQEHIVTTIATIELPLGYLVMAYFDHLPIKTP